MQSFQIILIILLRKIILTLNLKKMKKVFLTLAVVFATSTVLVSCGGKKDDASGNASENGSAKS